MARSASDETRDINAIIAIGKAIAARAAQAETVADIDYELYQWVEQLEDLRHTANAQGSVRTAPLSRGDTPPRA